MLEIDEEIWVALAPMVVRQRLRESARWRKAEITGVRRIVVIDDAPLMTWQLSGRYEGNAEVAIAESGHGASVRYRVQAAPAQGRGAMRDAERHVVAWKLVMWSIQ